MPSALAEWTWQRSKLCAQAERTFGKEACSSARVIALWRGMLGALLEHVYVLRAEVSWFWQSCKCWLMPARQSFPSWLQLPAGRSRHLQEQALIYFGGTYLLAPDSTLSGHNFTSLLCHQDTRVVCQGRAVASPVPPVLHAWYAHRFEPISPTIAPLEHPCAGPPVWSTRLVQPALQSRPPRMRTQVRLFDVRGLCSQLSGGTGPGCSSGSHVTAVADVAGTGVPAAGEQQPKRPRVSKTHVSHPAELAVLAHPRVSATAPMHSIAWGKWLVYLVLP